MEYSEDSEDHSSKSPVRKVHKYTDGTREPIFDAKNRRIPPPILMEVRDNSGSSSESEEEEEANVTSENHYQTSSALPRAPGAPVRRPSKSLSPVRRRLSLEVEGAPSGEGTSSASTSKLSKQPAAPRTSHTRSPPSASSHPDNPHYKLIEPWFHGHHKYITALKFSPCGRYLASCAEDRLIRIWKIADGVYRQIRELVGHKAALNDIVWSEDSRRIISSSDDCTVKIWETGLDKPLLQMQTIQEYRSLRKHENIVMCVAYGVRDFGIQRIELIASGSHDEEVIIWDLEKGTILHYLEGHTAPITSVDFNNDASLLASSSYDGSVRLWDTSTGEWMMSVVKDPQRPVSFARFSRADDDYLLIGTLDSKIRLWNYMTWKEMVTYEGHQNTKYCIVANFCFGKYIVCGSEDGFVYIWTLAGDLVQRFFTHSRTDRRGDLRLVLATAVHPHTNIIATTSFNGADNHIRLWASEVTNVVKRKRKQKQLEPKETMVGEVQEEIVAQEKSTQQSDLLESRDQEG